MHVTAIILAAGEGRRMGGATAKIYLPIAGRPLVLRTLDHIFSARSVDDVVLVAGAGDVERCRAMLRADAALRDRPCVLQIGGATRQQSARRGLEKTSSATEIIIIHDGARPFVSAQLVDRCVDAAVQKGAVVVGLAARDTIKIINPDRSVQRTPDRDSLWEIQTPQVFQRDLIMSAHAWAERAGIDVTDDAMVLERMGKSVYVLEGERTNFKITVPEDIWLAETLIREGRVP